jgi:hypothetical protein
MIRRFRIAWRNLALIFTIIILHGCAFRPATRFSGDHFNRHLNAVWLGVEWVNSPHTSAEYANLADDLHRHDIHYVFVYVSYLHNTGNFGASYGYSTDFLLAMRRDAPDLKFLAWIGLPLSYVDLTAADVRAKIVSFCASLTRIYGYDGIHLDPELIEDGNRDVLSLLDETRAGIGPSAILSIASSKVWPLRPDTAADKLGPILWSARYYREVAARVDQIAVMVYDSGLPQGWMYRLWTRFQVIQITKALAGTRTEVLFGLPTSEEPTLTHHPDAETIMSGLDGVIDGLNDRESIPDAVTGVVIYDYWETTPEKWAVYDRIWLGH